MLAEPQVNFHLHYEKIQSRRKLEQVGGWGEKRRKALLIWKTGASAFWRRQFLDRFPQPVFCKTMVLVHVFWCSIPFQSNWVFSRHSDNTAVRRGLCQHHISPYAVWLGTRGNSKGDTIRSIRRSIRRSQPTVEIIIPVQENDLSPFPGTSVALI